MPCRVEQPVVWLNGAYLPLAEARISPLDRGFQYGDGLFETLRADRGRVLHLHRHTRRLASAAARYRLPTTVLGKLPWDSIITGLLTRNRLHEQIARVKIIVTRGAVSLPLGLPETDHPTVCLTAASYRPPAPDDYRRGWSAHLSVIGAAPPLAGHKTLNYLFFLAARQEAIDHGKDEAIIVGADHCLAETAAGSLLLLRGDTWYQPEHALQLPGITIERVLQLLRELDCPVQTAKIPATDLPSFDGIWTLNSMIGLMPIREIDGRAFPVLRQDFAGFLRKQLFEVS